MNYHSLLLLLLITTPITVVADIGYDWTRWSVTRGGSTKSNSNSNTSIASNGNHKKAISNNAGKNSSSSSSNSKNPSDRSIISNSVDTTELLRKPVKGMPSVFREEEVAYDRYAACLAATEVLRQTRDNTIQRGDESGRQSQQQQDEGDGPCNPIAQLCAKLNPYSSVGTKKNMPIGASSDQPVDKNSMVYKQANAQYLINASKVIKALGLSVAQFNSLSREVNANEIMREKVMEQAYLYRLAATLNMDKVPLLEDTQSQELLKAHKRKRVQMFARSMSEIEELRTEQLKALTRSLHVDRIPEGINICDPQVLPILSPKVRAVCEAFPLQAEEIVKKYGLNSDEFNEMYEETQNNPVFRWRVNKYMEKASAEDN